MQRLRDFKRYVAELGRRTLTPASRNPYILKAPVRPPMTDPLARLVDEMLWTGRWSYLRYRHAREILRQHCPKTARLLSLGCGSGKHEYAFALEFKYAQVLGLDISAEVAGYCQDKYAPQKNLRFAAGDVLTHEGNYDFIYTIEVLEHIEEPFPVLRRLTELAPRILVIVPNKRPGDDTPERRRQAWERHGHHHVGFTIDELAEPLREAGFAIVAGRSIYFESTGHVRRIFGHLQEHYPQLSRNDLPMLDLFRRAYDHDLRLSALPEWAGRGEGTLVYAEKA